MYDFIDYWVKAVLAAKTELWQIENIDQIVEYI